MTEKILTPIVAEWLQGQGYYVACEVMLCGYCDLIGCKWEERIGRRKPPMQEIIAVELKIKDIRGVLYQGKSNKRVADYSYAAMPLEFCAKMRPQTLDLFKKIGVGLLGVDLVLGVNVIIPAPKNDIKHNPNVCRRLWSFRLRHRKAEKNGR